MTRLKYSREDLTPGAGPVQLEIQGDCNKAVAAVIEQFGAVKVLEGVAHYCEKHLGLDIWAEQIRSAREILHPSGESRLEEERRRRP